MGDVTQHTVLYDAHLAAGGRMVAFAGYDMPVHYAGARGGVLAEHRWTREHAGLFDVSHMGPAWLRLAAPSGEGETDHRAAAEILETLVCGDLVGLHPGQLRYSLLLNDAGGVVDDLIIGRPRAPELQGSLYLVANAGAKEGDFARIVAASGARARLERADSGGLLAVQGPEAAAVVETLFPGASTLPFMTFASFEAPGGGVRHLARSGYTGEDGFEILASAGDAPALWDRLLADRRVAPVGLGARDSLRLEAGLPLHGHDIDAETSPIEAGLGFAVPKRRRAAADFPGAARVLRELATGPSRVRAGLRLAGGAAPAREGAVITDGDGAQVGRVTSGGPSPTLGRGVALAYLEPRCAAIGTPLTIDVRGRPQPAEVVATPFVPHRYVRRPVPPT